jgi:hypothetical protein
MATACLTKALGGDQRCQTIWERWRDAGECESTLIGAVALVGARYIGRP